MPMRVEVLTAVHAAYERYLPDAWRSLAAQTHTDWRWLVQVDGELDGIPTALSRCGALADPRVSLSANGTREGAAVTRNVALGRSAAPLIQNLDADDELEPTALSTLLTALRDHPDAGFAVGPARDLHASGALREFPIALPDGPIPRGALVDAWITEPDRYRVPVHPAGVMWRRDLLLTVGGWSAAHGMEDTALLMAASALAPGVVVRGPTLRYRRHRAQTSTKVSGFEGGGGEQISLVRSRAALLRAGPPWQGSPLTAGEFAAE